MKRKAETDIVRACLQALKALGIVAWRQQSGKVRVRGGWMELAPEGTPDIIGYLKDGRMLAVEVKQPGEELRKEQEAWMERAWKSNVVALLVFSASHLVEELGSILAEAA